MLNNLQNSESTIQCIFNRLWEIITSKSSPQRGIVLHRRVYRVVFYNIKIKNEPVNVAYQDKAHKIPLILLFHQKKIHSVGFVGW